MMNIFVAFAAPLGVAKYLMCFFFRAILNHHWARFIGWWMSWFILAFRSSQQLI
jgi:hypothetical protein